MQSVVAPTSLFFKTCGTEIRVPDLPECIDVTHPFPKKYKEMSKQFTERRKGDVTIMIGEKVLYGHKELLMHRIPFFYSLFNSKMVECSEGEIVKLSSDYCCFNFVTIEQLLNYAYTGHLRISEDNVQNLMIGANYFNMESVVDECALFISKRMSVDNRNFVPISMTTDFLALSVDDICDILQRDTLHVDDEKQVFEAISGWMENDGERTNYAARLLRCVRCTRHRHKSLISIMENTDWVMANGECMGIVNDFKMHPNVDEMVINAERICDEAHKIIFSIGRNAVQLYYPITNTWMKVPIEKRSGICLRNRENIAVIDQKIYFFGCKGEVFDTVANEWTTMPDISPERCNMATGIIDGKLYINGGNDHKRPDYTLCSTKRYDPSTKVFGGHDFAKFDHSEYYTPETDRWTDIACMTHRRTGCAAAVFNRQIYVVGGRDRKKILREMEKYDPATNTWTELRSMKTRRMFPTLVVSCGKLFVVGGYDSVDMINALSTVEMYNPDTDTWESRASMIDYPCHIGVLPVPASIPSPATNIEHGYIDGFHHFHLKPELLKAIIECELTHPSEVQYECIPQLINGRDLICQAKSGMGKTVSFVISSLQQLESLDGHVPTLVLCHSRELASKIGCEYRRFAKYLPDIKVDVVPFNENDNAINRPNILIGTPGSIYDLFKSGTIKLSTIKHVIVDECDKLMSDPGMCGDMENILKLTSKDKQLMLFSSVLRKKFGAAWEKFMRDVSQRYQFLRL